MSINYKLKHFIDLHKRTTMKKISATFLLGLAVLISMPTSIISANPGSALIVADPPDDTYYYEYTEVIFADDVSPDGEAVNEKSIFQIPANGPAKITVALFNDEPLLTKEIVVEIYAEDNTLYDSFSISTKEEWNWCKFSIDIKEPGKYAIDLYNENDVYINTGYVDVVK
jgi:hypothetical protein